MSSTGAIISRLRKVRSNVEEFRKNCFVSTSVRSLRFRWTYWKHSKWRRKRFRYETACSLKSWPCNDWNLIWIDAWLIPIILDAVLTTPSIKNADENVNYWCNIWADGKMNASSCCNYWKYSFLLIILSGRSAARCHRKFFDEHTLVGCWCRQSLRYSWFVGKLLFLTISTAQYAAKLRSRQCMGGGVDLLYIL